MKRLFWATAACKWEKKPRVQVHVHTILLRTTPSERLQNASQGTEYPSQGTRKEDCRRDKGQTKKALDCGLDGRPPVAVACMGAATVLVGCPSHQKKCMDWESSAYERSFGDLTSRELHHVCVWLIGASDTQDAFSAGL